MGWLRGWRAKNPGAPLWKLPWWDCLWRVVSWLILMVFYQHRWWGVRHIPDSGPVLLLCNHQSYLDLIALGVGLDRRHFHPMARQTLFRNPVFGWFIGSLNAFPVDQENADVKSLRRAISHLKEGHLLMVFPEGSRTPDGSLQQFEQGVMLLIRRAKATVVPMAVEGCFDAWPIHGKPTARARTGAIYGEPIPAEDLLKLKPEQAIERLFGEIETLQMTLRDRLRTLHQGRFPRYNPQIDDQPSRSEPSPEGH